MKQENGGPSCCWHRGAREDAGREGAVACSSNFSTHFLFFTLITSIFDVCNLTFHLLDDVQARKWQQMNSKRYATKRKFGYVQAPQTEMPAGKYSPSIQLTKLAELYLY